MLACDPLPATRIVAVEAALDAADWTGHDALRLAPDEVLVIGTDSATVALNDDHAIVERDHGWVGAWLDAGSLHHLVSRHIEWALPAERPALAQGNIAGVPAKLHLPADSDGALLICLAAFAHELEERVG